MDRAILNRMDAYNHVESFLWLGMKMGLFTRATQTRAQTICINSVMKNRTWPPSTWDIVK